jgi:hypothetical protein
MAGLLTFPSQAPSHFNLRSLGEGGFFLPSCYKVKSYQTSSFVETSEDKSGRVLPETHQGLQLRQQFRIYTGFPFNLVHENKPDTNLDAKLIK